MPWQLISTHCGISDIFGHGPVAAVLPVQSSDTKAGLTIAENLQEAALSGM